MGQQTIGIGGMGTGAVAGLEGSGAVGTAGRENNSYSAGVIGKIGGEVIDLAGNNGPAIGSGIMAGDFGRSQG